MAFAALLNTAPGSVTELGEWLSALHGKMTETSALSALLERVFDVGVVSLVMLLVSLIISFYGKNFVEGIKFFLFFYVGFLCGEFFFPQLLPFTVSPWILGMILGIVAALLAKPLYLVVYPVAIGYIVYILSAGSGSAVAIVLAVALALLALAVRNFLEPLFVSLLGAYWFAFFIAKLFAGGALSPTLNTVIIVAITSAGYVYQLKNSHKY